MHPDRFNPPLLSSQGRNPTWGRPARKSRPQRSLSPSCSSQTSGRWRTSSMSLHWSSSSSSGHMLSEKRTGSSTCWRKTSSMRKSTPKTKETHVCGRVWRGHLIQAQMCSLKKRRKVSLLVTVWLVQTCDCSIMWSCRTIRLWRSDQTGARSVIPVRGSQLDEELAFRQQVAFPAAPTSTPTPQTSIPFHFHFKGRPRRGPPPAHVRWRPVQQLVGPRPLIGSAVLRSKQNIFIGSVLFGCVWLYFNSLLWLSFVCKGGDIFHGETTSPCLTTTTNLKRF